jgi:hypothetical protein
MAFKGDHRCGRLLLLQRVTNDIAVPNRLVGRLERIVEGDVEESHSRIEGARPVRRRAKVRQPGQRMVHGLHWSKHVPAARTSDTHNDPDIGQGL